MKQIKICLCLKKGRIKSGRQVYILKGDGSGCGKLHPTSWFSFPQYFDASCCLFRTCSSPVFQTINQTMHYTNSITWHQPQTCHSSPTLHQTLLHAQSPHKSSHIFSVYLISICISYFLTSHLHNILTQGATFNITHFESKITHLLYTAINTTEHGQISQCLGFTKSLTFSIQRLGDVLHDNQGIAAISQVHLSWRDVQCPA